jgi:hypothetical protein
MKLRTDARNVDGKQRLLQSVTKDRLIGQEDCVVVILWNNLSSNHPFAIRNTSKGEEKHQSQLRFDKII